MTGDLLIATKVPADSLEVGDVVSLPSALTDSLVTHRITAIEAADGARTITMKGDANEFSDALDYPVTGDVEAGGAASRVGNRDHADDDARCRLPLLLGLLGLLGLSMMSPVEHPARKPLTT